MTLRTALIIDGDASGAAKAAGAAEAGLRKVDSAANAAAAGARNLAGAERAQEAALQGSTAAMRANSAALAANNAVTRQALAQRTNLIFQLNDIFVSLASGQNAAMVAIQQGSQISTIYGPGGLGKALSETGKIVTGVVARFAPLLAITAVASAGIAGLTQEINRTGNSVKVSFGDVALGVIQTFGEYIYSAIKPAIDATSQWFADNWKTVSKLTGDLVNFMVRNFVGFGIRVEQIVANLPDVFAVVGEAIAKAFLTPIQFIIDQTIGGINNLIDGINSLGANIARLNGLKIDVDFGSSGALTRIGERNKAFDARIAENDQTDYAAQFVADIARNARQNAIERDKDKKTKASKQSDYDREIEQIRERIGALQVESNVIGLSTFAAEKMRKTLELETAARKDAIGLSAERVIQIETEASAYARAAAALEQQEAAFDTISGAGESAIDRLTDAFLDGGESIGEAINGIIKDLTRLAIEMAIVNPIKNTLFGGSNPTFAGLGDALGNLFGGARAAGGPVSPGKLYRVGEQGEEWFAPGVAGTIVPNHQLGGNGGGFTQVIRNYSGEKISTKQRKGPDGGTLQEMVIGTVRDSMARDEFRANGIRGATKSR